MWLMMNILGSEGVEVKPETAKQTHKKSHEYDKICLDVVTLWFFFFFFLAMLYGMWDIISPTRDQTQAHGSESSES